MNKMRILLAIGSKAPEYYQSYVDAIENFGIFTPGGDRPFPRNYIVYHNKDAKGFTSPRWYGT